MNGETDATLEGVRTDLSLSEGRVIMTVESEPSTVRLFRPERHPLPRSEPALTLEMRGEGFHGSVWLSGAEAEALVPALQASFGALQASFGDLTDGAEAGTPDVVLDRDGGRR